MSELIDSFEPTKATELQKIESGQEEVVRLLQSISRKVCAAPDPTRDRPSAPHPIVQRLLVLPVKPVR